MRILLSFIIGHTLKRVCLFFFRFFFVFFSFFVFFVTVLLFGYLRMISFCVRLRNIFKQLLQKLDP